MGRYKNFGTRSSVLFLCFFMIFHISCVEEYMPGVSKSENLLIVDGGITNDPGPYSVALSISQGVEDEVTLPLSGATVRIEEKDGFAEILTEVREGFYQSSPDKIQGIPGREYRLVIEAGQKRYESEWMYMKKCPEIDNLYWQRDVRNGIDLDYDGIQIYIDTHDPDNSTRYYRWEYKEAWAFSAPISSSWNPTMCYSKSNSSSIMIGTTERYQSDRLEKQPIVYINQTTSRLILRYRFIVIQHAINQREYRYWEALEELNENLGTLFDPIPARINGNVRNINDPKESVLGFFTCSSVKKDTMYVDVRDFYNDPIVFISPYKDCNFRTFEGDNNTEVARYLRYGWLLADTVRDGLVLITTLANSRFCFDCTTSGDPEPPVDWIPFTYNK